MQPHIHVRVLPLPRDYDDGEIITIVEQGKEFRMKLVESAFKGEREIRIIPIDRLASNH